MSRHVAPHRLADLCAGRVSEAEERTLRGHLADCRRCAQALERIEAGRLAMREIASAAAPELGWDHVGARIYWATSKERRTTQQRALRVPVGRRALWTGSLLVSAAAAAVAMGYLLWPQGGGEAAVGKLGADVRATPARTVENEPSARPAPLQAIVTLAKGSVELSGQALSMDSRLGEGTILRTLDGQVAVQFGDRNGFELGPNSQLELLRFDDRRIELAVTGLIDVDITKRHAGQELVVVAGQHQVVVRGTAFRVEHRDGALGVACKRGRVVVTDGSDQVDVMAGHEFRMLTTAWHEAALRATPLDPVAMAQLDKAVSVPMLPVWTDLDTLTETSSTLELVAEPGQMVAIDGVEVASGAFFVRTMSGRHQVAVVDSDGEMGPGEWLDAEPGKRARATIAEAADRGEHDEAPARKRQLAREIEARGQARQCLEPLAKQGLVEGSYIVFDVGVNAEGSQALLNVVDSNLSPRIQACLRHAVDAVTLPSGSRARFRLRMSF